MRRLVALLLVGCSGSPFATSTASEDAAAWNDSGAPASAGNDSGAGALPGTGGASHGAGGDPADSGGGASPFGGAPAAGGSAPGGHDGAGGESGAATGGAGMGGATEASGGAPAGTGGATCAPAACQDNCGNVVPGDLCCTAAGECGCMFGPWCYRSSACTPMGENALNCDASRPFMFLCPGTTLPPGGDCVPGPAGSNPFYCCATESR